MGLPGLFLAAALPVLLYLALVMPLGEPADEGTHLIRAAALSAGQWVGHRGVITVPGETTPRTVTGYDIDPAYVAVQSALPQAPPRSPKPMTDANRARQRALPWYGGTFFAEATNTAVYPPPFFLPAALAIGGARALGAGPYQTIIAARLANGAAFLLIGMAALALARRGRAILFALLLMPMSLALGAAVTQEGPMIATACLAAAWLGRGPRTFWPGVAALALVILAKPPYAPLAALALLPLHPVPWRLARHGLGVVAAMAPALAWYLHALPRAGAPFWRPAYPAGPLWPGPPGTVFQSTDAAAQLAVFASHPGAAFTTILAAVQRDGLYLPIQFIGSLGHLDIPLALWLYPLWALALLGTLAVGLCRAVDQPAGARPAVAVLLGLAALATILFLYWVQYVTWTNVGDTIAEGVQGRYFIPIAALLTPALPLLRHPLPARLRTTLTLAPVALAVLGWALIPLAIQARFSP